MILEMSKCSYENEDQGMTDHKNDIRDESATHENEDQAMTDYENDIGDESATYKNEDQGMAVADHENATGDVQVLVIKIKTKE